MLLPSPAQNLGLRFPPWHIRFQPKPLAPPGTCVVVHVTPAQCQNMPPHGIDRWYVGSSIKRYRCHKCYIPSTFGVRDALTVN